MSHPTSRLDPAIHQPARLGILSAVCETKRVDFVSLRELLDLTDGNLSRHLSTLESAGYQGWYVLEQDVKLDGAPESEGPAADVRTSLAYLLSGAESNPIPG